MRHTGLFAYPRSLRLVVYLLAAWFLLNAADVFTTYQALSTGQAAEMNPCVRLIVGLPVLLTVLKMTMAYIGAKIAERMALANPGAAIGTLFAVNAFVFYACVNNLNVCRQALMQ